MLVSFGASGVGLLRDAGNSGVVPGALRSLNLLPGQAHSGLDLVDGSVVTREGARLSETLVAQVAGEGAHIVVAPVVHDQARALLEDFVAVAELADEVGLQPVVLRIQHLESFI